jgi:GT2 family glycosyltransferase
MGLHARENPEAVAIITCFNERDQVLICLDSLQQDHPGIGAIVIDDGSTDGTAEAVLAAHPWVRVLRGDGELWWSGATNMGLAAAREQGASYVVLLNNDSTVPAGGIAELLSASRAAGGAIVAPAVADLLTKVPESFGGIITPKGPDYLTAAPALDEHGLADVDWLPGHVLVIPVAVLDRVGYADARRFPQYWGDTDLTMRAVRAGVRVTVMPSVLALNDRRQTGLRLKTPIRPKNLWAVLTSRRSWLRVPDNISFWSRHRDVLTWRQLARRYEGIPLALGYEVLDVLRLRGLARSLWRRLH